MKKLVHFCSVSFVLLVGLTPLQSVQADQTLSAVPVDSSAVNAAPFQNLLDVYHQALNNDPALKSALSANKAAQEIIEQGKALYRPQVNFTAGARATQNHIEYVGANVFQNEGRNSFEGYEYGVTARQPLFRKQNLIAIDQTKTQVSIADKQYHLTQQQLILKVTEAYFNILIAQDAIDLLQAQKAAIQSQLDQAKANFDVGNATITDFNEAKARYDIVVAQEIAAKNSHQVALFALESLTSQTPTTLATIKAEAATNALAQDMQAWIDIGLKNNLAIQIRQDAYKLAEQEVKRNSAAHLPTLDAVASYTKSYENGGNFGFGLDLNAAVISLQLAVPLYQGGAISSRTRQAAFNQQKAQEDIAVAKRNTVLATQQAYLNLSSNVAQISALAQALNSTQSQLASTQVGYDVGVRTSVDLLNAQQLMFSAKRDLLAARYQYLMNIVRLKTATGQVAEADLADINQLLTTP
jgi:outer membrane protein